MLNSRTPRALWATLFFVPAFGIGCADEAASFAEVETIFAQSCAFSTCHAGGESPDLSEGSAYDAIVDATAAVGGETLVVPGDSDASYLVQKLEGASGITGDPMPPSASLTDDEIETIRSWVDGGALAD